MVVVVAIVVVAFRMDRTVLMVAAVVVVVVVAVAVGRETDSEIDSCLGFGFEIVLWLRGGMGMVRGLQASRRHLIDAPDVVLVVVVIVVIVVVVC